MRQDCLSQVGEFLWDKASPEVVLSASDKQPGVSKKDSKLMGQEEGEKVDHLFKRVSILLQKGLSAMLLNRIPGHPAAEIDGQI